MVAWVVPVANVTIHPSIIHPPYCSLPSWNNPLPCPWHCARYNGQGESKFADKQRLLIATMGVMPWSASLGASPFLLALPPSRSLFLHFFFPHPLCTSLSRQRLTLFTFFFFFALCPVTPSNPKNNNFSWDFFYSSA
ncbi:hypothetical protein B9Z19DRAFT_505272 [Tuber borchii]|uniref:Uncharacterized protein n=1 Tax=Tuber borchii TaxID=42251 RepID=A0A2T7A326_TUBBO|nr:hypothetical protein B9Z19DRAFT_505272 [Tuber borchii]